MSCWESYKYHSYQLQITIMRHISLFLVVTLLCCVGCRIDVHQQTDFFNGEMSYLYEDAEQYTSAEDFVVTEAVSVIHVDWIFDNVIVRRYDGSGIRCYETNSHSNDTTRMRYRVDGDKCDVRCCQSGRYDRSPFQTAQTKVLTILLPQGLQLDTLHIHAVSADISIDSSCSSNLVIETINGDIEVSNCKSRGITIRNISGDVAIRHCVDDSINVENLSGDIDIVACGASRFVVSNVSGDISFAKCNGSDFVVTTISGYVEIEVFDDNFVIFYNTVSGVFRSDMHVVKKGSTYMSGDGSRKYHINTVSGDVDVEIE